MIPFLGAAASPWPAGARVPHLYALPDPALPENREVFALAARHRAILTDRFPDLLTPVDPRWLHTPVRMIAAPTAPPLPQATLDTLIERLRRALAAQSRFTVWAAPYAGRFGTGLDLHPDQHFEQLAQTTGTAVEAVLGDQAPARRRGPALITTGYARAEADSGPVMGALLASRPTRAPLTITELALVETVQDPTGPTFQWPEPLARFPLPREHRMHLHRRYFDLVAQGSKTTEVRVNDATRQLLIEGDLIRFACEGEEVRTRITRLARYRDFDAMYEQEALASINPTTSRAEQLRGLREIYPPERESLGALAIGIELLPD